TELLDCLMALRDVGAGTERARDVPIGPAEQRVPPLDQPFGARLREHRILDDREVPLEQLRQRSRDRLACARGYTGAYPGTAKQFALGPSEKVAPLPVD